MEKGKSISNVLAITTSVLALAALVLTPSQASAQDLGEVAKIHGFGGWAYGETDGLAYLIGTEAGEYHNADFALNITAQPFENLSVVAQLRAEAIAGKDDFELDYAFAAWKFSDLLSVRAGRVKHPFGLYGEIFDVGTLRPFYSLPQSLYGPNGYTARAYNGIGVVGWTEGASGWGLQYDIYAGQIEGDFEIPGMITTDPNRFLDPGINVGFEVNQTLGARLKLTTPIEGLSFGISGYYGDDETFLDLPSPLEEDAAREVTLASLEYVDRRWSIRAEYGTLKRDIDFELDGGYIEAAYKVTDHWQLAGRKDTFDLVLPSTDLSLLPPFFGQLLSHDELAFGINYWFSSHFVVRLSYHQAKGNRAAFLETSEQILELLMTGELEDKTDLIVFGAQFSF